MLSKQEVTARYQSGAKYYDFATRLYRLVGLRIDVYRSHAVDLLRLERGDCVVELGCATGLNFPLILERIGPEGRLIGVDLTPGMLACAQEKVEHAGWENVELVQSNVEAYGVPDGVNAILSIGVFGYVAEYDRVIEAASQALAPGGRLVIVDGKRPERWLFRILFRLVLWFSRPFGVTPDYGKHHTWESVERHFRETALDQMYGGAIYASSGTAPHHTSSIGRSPRNCLSEGPELPQPSPLPGPSGRLQET